MTKTLYLLRHTKAEESVPGSTAKDHARALAPRGKRAAKTMSGHFATQILSVDRVYCSASKRTRETFDAVREGLKNPAVSFRDALYLSPSEELIAFVQALPDTLHSAMIIGHNPGLHDVALMLISRAGRGQAKALEKLRTKFPTGAFCALSFDVASWKKVGAGLATLTTFVRPRDLDHAD